MDYLKIRVLSGRQNEVTREKINFGFQMLNSYDLSHTEAILVTLKPSLVTLTSSSSSS